MIVYILTCQSSLLINGSSGFSLINTGYFVSFILLEHHFQDKCQSTFTVAPYAIPKLSKSGT